MANLLSLASRLVFSSLEAEALSGDQSASRQHLPERLIRSNAEITLDLHS